MSDVLSCLESQGCLNRKSRIFILLLLIPLFYLPIAFSAQPCFCLVFFSANSPEHFVKVVGR